jgi:ribosome biogenesis GTPase
MSSLGWDGAWAAAFSRHAAAGLSPARAVAEHRGAYDVLVGADATPMAARVTGRLLHGAITPGALPVVGDWVAAVVRADEGTASIHAVVARRTRIQRRAPVDHRGPVQILAANVDVVINALLGEPRLSTSEVRAGDARGRHTTTRRQLVPLPSGGLLLDTPGIRELGLWDGSAGLAGAFADVETTAADCRFSDCTHQRQPGCAVEAAVERGELASDRVAGWLKLIREERRRSSEQDAVARRAERKRWAAVVRAGAARAVEKRGARGH